MMCEFNFNHDTNRLSYKTYTFCTLKTTVVNRYKNLSKLLSIQLPSQNFDKKHIRTVRGVRGMGMIPGSVRGLVKKKSSDAGRNKSQ